MASVLGKVGVSPYADEDAANTTRFTLLSRAATRTFNVPSTLIRLQGILNGAWHRRACCQVNHIFRLMHGLLDGLYVGDRIP